MAQERFVALWVGTTCEPIPVEDHPNVLCYEHQVSDGPVGERSQGFDFWNAEEALEFALKHADFVIIEEDFRP